MSRLSKNTLYNLVGQGLVLALSLVSVKLIFSRLGPDALGIVYLNLALTAIVVSGLELGISATTVREVSANYVSDRAYVTQLIRTASTVYWVITALLAVIAYLSTPWLVQHWINLQSLSPTATIESFRILNIAAVLSLPKVLYTSLFRGRQRMEINNAIDFGMAALQQAGTAAIVIKGGGLCQVAAWIAVCAGVALLAYLLMTVRLFSWRTIVPGFSLAVLRRNAAFAVHMMSTSLLAIVHTQTDKLFISKLLPLVQFGYYGVASNVGARAMLVPIAVGQAALPSLSALARSGDHHNMTTQYRKLQEFVCLIAAPIFTGIVFASFPLFGYLLNQEAARLLLVPMALLSLGFYMNSTLTIPYMLCLATGRPDIVSRTNLWALLFSLPLTAALILWLGLTGAGLAWVGYHLVVYAYMVPRVSRECLGQPPANWLLQVSRAVIVAMVFYAPAWMLAQAAGPHHAVPLAIAWLAATAAFCLASVVFMGPELRSVLLALRLRAVETR